MDLTDSHHATHWLRQAEETFNCSASGYRRRWMKGKGKNRWGKITEKALGGAQGSKRFLRKTWSPFLRSQRSLLWEIKKTSGSSEAIKLFIVFHVLVWCQQHNFELFTNETQILHVLPALYPYKRIKVALNFALLDKIVTPCPNQEQSMILCEIDFILTRHKVNKEHDKNTTVN